MPFDPSRAEGYAPTMEEILEDVGVTSVDQLKEALLSRCRELYEKARKNKEIEDFGTPHEFTVCDSSGFFQTLVNMGHGNSSMVILDDYSPEAHFLMFKDKILRRFRPIVAAHEAAEYTAVREGMDQGEAHRMASAAELKAAETLGLKRKYLLFLRRHYRSKLQELFEWGLV